MGLISWLKKRKEEKRKQYEENLADELHRERELQEYFDIRDTNEIILGDLKRLVYNDNTGVMVYDGDIGGHNANVDRSINLRKYPLSCHREIPNSIVLYESRIDDGTVIDRIYHTTKKIISSKL